MPRGLRSQGERTLARACFVVPLVAYLAVYFAEGTTFGPSGDGFYSWIFARSLAFDGDLDFTNDYALCGDPFGAGLDRGTGHPDNPFYLGPAAFWAPPLLVLRAVFTLLFGAARAAEASCHGWMPALAMLAGPLAGAVTVWLAYRAARLVASAPVSAFAALLFAFMSPLFPYATSVAHYSHVYLTSVVAVLTYTSLRVALRGARPWDAGTIALALFVAVLHRLPAALYAALPAAALLAARARGRRLGIGAATVGGVAAGIAATLALYTYLYGTPFALPQGPDYVHPDHAHPWLVLFGVRGGLFFWTPAAWISVVGVAIGARLPRLRLFTAACLAAALLELVVSSAPLDWHGNWSLGARRLLPLTPMLVVFAALALERLPRAWRSGAWPRRAAWAIVALVLVNNVHASLSVRGDREVSQRDLYGGWSPLRPLWAGLDALGVDVALLPAEIWFRARYGLPTRAYREAITPRYKRNYRDLSFSATTLDLTAANARDLVAPGRWTPDGVSIDATESPLVFTCEWPFATHLRLRLQGPAGARVHVARRGPSPFARRVDLGVVTLDPSTSVVELPVPPTGLDSGLNELLLTAEGAPVVLRALEIEDRTPRTPHG